MTDIAGVKIPEGMNVSGVIFQESYTQARDEFGNGYIEFDTDGKIKVAEYSDSSYGEPPKDVKAYNESIKNFTGILDMIEFAIIAIRGQLVFGFGCATPDAVAMFSTFYKWERTRENIHGHFDSLEEEAVGEFERTLNHFIRGLSKPLNEAIVFEDFIDQSSPYFRQYTGHMSKDDWMEHIQTVREMYQTGTMNNADSYLAQRWAASFARERTLPLI